MPQELLVVNGSIDGYAPLKRIELIWANRKAWFCLYCIDEDGLEFPALIEFEHSSLVLRVAEHLADAQSIDADFPVIPVTRVGETLMVHRSQAFFDYPPPPPEPAHPPSPDQICQVSP